jgi:hypothetical protein
MTLITAGAMTVFLIVAELSRASSYGLNQSIATEAGQTGTYDVEFSTTSGMDPQALAARVTPVLLRYSSRRPVLIEMVPQIPLDCPPGQTLGSASLLFVRDSDGRLLERSPGNRLPDGTRVCLAGQEISSSAVRQPTQSELFDWLGVTPGVSSPALIVEGTYERLALLNAEQPADLTFAIVTGQQGDESASIEGALDQAFGSLSVTYGQAPTFQVERRDTFQAVRQAASGVDLVYSIIAWGVLALGALGLLVAEIIIVRDRSWFFGLARAVGARSAHIATLILIDILLVLAAGTALALLLVLALQPFAAAFAQNTFQVTGVRFLRLSTVPQLILGEMVILIMAGLYPALKAVRQDPLDVLEPRVA